VVLDITALPAPLRKGIYDHVLVSRLIIVAEALAANALIVPVIVTVERAVTVNSPAPRLMTFIRVPTGNATEALAGTLITFAVATFMVTVLPASVSTRV
jgi:hypothetical protein